jgi:hypothetical protein
MYNYISQVVKVKNIFCLTHFELKKCFLAVMRRPDYAIRQFGVESIFQLSAVLSCLSFDTLVGHRFK